MSRHYGRKEGTLDLEFRPSHQATAHGGQLAVAGLVREFGLWKKLQNYPALDPRQDKHKGFEVTVSHSAGVMGCPSCGHSLFLPALLINLGHQMEGKSGETRTFFCAPLKVISACALSEPILHLQAGHPLKFIHVVGH